MTKTNMVEHIGERVSVSLLSNHLKGTVGPAVVYWRGRRYTITKVDFRHTLHDGRTLCHVFSVTDGNTFFKLMFNTEDLHWRLLEIASS